MSAGAGGISLTRLEELAGKATPGPWSVDKGHVFVDHREQVCCGNPRVGDAPWDEPQCCGYPNVEGEYFQVAETAESTAPYIAAASPEVILALVRAVRALIQAENALADYIPTIEKTGAILNYGHKVLRDARESLAQFEDV